MPLPRRLRLSCPSPAFHASTAKGPGLRGLWGPPPRPRHLLHFCWVTSEIWDQLSRNRLTFHFAGESRDRPGDREFSRFWGCLCRPFSRGSGRASWRLGHADRASPDESHLASAQDPQRVQSSTTALQVHRLLRRIRVQVERSLDLASARIPGPQRWRLRPGVPRMPLRQRPSHISRDRSECGAEEAIDVPVQSN